MSVVADPAAVPPELVALTNRLGDPSADLVVLAEGNTSTVDAEGRLVIKASGSQMHSAGADDFVLVDLAEAADMMRNPAATQADLTALLAVGDGSSRRASIETLVHVAAAAVAGATWVAHTHPTAVVATVSVADAESRWTSALFPDEAVVVGVPAWVPYQEPGLALGRAVADAITRRGDADGVPPRCVLLGNHGLVALGGSPEEVSAVTAMAVKAARVRMLAASLGAPAYLDPTTAAALAGRADEVERRRLLAGGRG
jgi:rhamnose utilization protein RhaD (predicted bifunctional aldolase and dehydrogenase)